MQRPYAAYKSVAVLEGGQWARDSGGAWHLVAGTWKFKAGLTDEDIAYQYRDGYLLTPGRFEEILRALDVKE